MILAEATPDAAALYNFAMVFSFLASTAAAVVAIRSQSHVQKREITFTREYASKEELLHLVKDLERIETALTGLRGELSADRKIIMAAADERMEKLTERVDRLLEGVSHLKGIADRQLASH